jgi:hypothetical protein
VPENLFSNFTGDGPEFTENPVLREIHDLSSAVVLRHE